MDITQSPLLEALEPSAIVAEPEVAVAGLDMDLTECCGKPCSVVQRLCRYPASAGESAWFSVARPWPEVATVATKVGSVARAIRRS